ncbi:MAG: PRD domain-containing protein [Streptococcus sp.]|nr:PRD domain-containing protein [Streptococcus sp.]
MLTKRQKQILCELARQAPKMLTAAYFANFLSISDRTVQTEFKKIKTYFLNDRDIEIVSAVAKGTTIIIKDLEKFQNLVKSDENISSIQNQTERIRKLCFLLIQNKYNTNRLDLMNQLYVSSSTLNLDLNEAEIILSKFDLKLNRKSSKGIQIVGSEKHKRLFIMNMGYDINHLEIGQYQNNYLQKEIEKILVTTFIKYQFRISETLFQNLVVHIYMAVYRMKKGFFLKDDDYGDLPEFKVECQAAKEIYQYLCQKFYFKVNDGEISNLAVYIKGKSDFFEQEYITEEINNDLLEILEAIEIIYGMDFNQNFDLRLSLALHVIPLMTRVRYDIQNKNQMLDYIKENFPLAFDLAAFMCLRLQKKLNKKITEDEIAYLAIYFNQFLEQQKNIATKQNILIITTIKKSLSVLLRQRFLTWFPDKIGLLNIVHVNDIGTVSVEDYDVIFTTESNLSENFGAIMIAIYPDEKDYAKIKLAIDGFKDKYEVLDLFEETRFFVGNLKTKEDILNKLCEISHKKTTNLKEFKKAIELREELGSSYFKNQIALPHPINPIGADTFISVVLLEKPIKWDDDNHIQLAMLVSIEKNNTKAFQLWNYLTAIIQDKELTKRLLEQPTFNEFKNNIANLLENYI